FMISDGIMPTNEGRGYVLRRLIRRAARHGRLLGINGSFLSTLSKTVMAECRDGYPELEEKREFIIKVLEQEEKQFNKTIDQGLHILKDLKETLKNENKKILAGEDAFKLYDTYGFPLDLTMEILEEEGFTVDVTGFESSMEEQRNMARSARKGTNYMGTDVTVYQEIDSSITSTFVGYDTLVHTSKVMVLTTETDLVQALTDGQSGTVIVEETPFYATMGGQQGDIGSIQIGDTLFEVLDTIKLPGNKIGHVGQITSGMIKVGDRVTLSVCKKNRLATGKNHTATHLLQKALKTVLGNHVEQAGSYVNADRLRFDFSHFSAMTEDEIASVEKIVNEEIAKGMVVTTEEMTLEDAKKTGAMALFGEKYGKTVRVVKAGDFSIELCGGTHIANTSSISAFKILSETGIAAGVRRIEALTSEGVFTYYKHIEEELRAASHAAKTEPANLTKKIETMQEEIKNILSENQKLKEKLTKEAFGDVMDQVIEVKGVKLLSAKANDVDMNGLRTLGDQLRDKIGEGVIVLASAKDGKVSLLAMATEEAMKRGAHAGNLIKEIAGIVGGGGGGRPNMAQAGGKNPEGIEDAIHQVKVILELQIRG
ncbi:MAG: alanine--tRNA ligase, partial [Acetivibrio sp.]